MTQTFKELREFGYLLPAIGYFQVSEKVYEDDETGEEVIETSDLPADATPFPVKPGVDFQINDTNDGWSPIVRTDEEKRAQMPSLTSRQFWMAAASINLSKTDIVAKVEAGMEDSVDRKVLIAEITESTTFIRTNPSVTDVMAFVGIPDDQLDTLWTWATGL